jgi:hypothetical protein
MGYKILPQSSEGASFILLNPSKDLEEIPRFQNLESHLASSDPKAKMSVKRR